MILKDAPVAESDEERPGLILDFDEAGGAVGLVILNATRRAADPRAIEVSAAGLFEAAGQDGAYGRL